MKKHQVPFTPYAIRTTSLDQVVMPHQGKAGTRVYILLNGRDITQITQEASAVGGEATIYLTDGSGLALVDADGKPMTATVRGDVQISLEERVKRMAA